MTTCTWSNHEFKIYSHPGAKWNDVAGIYIFAKPGTQDGRWIALYIGQTKSFKDRLNDHERWEEARRLGATHVHAMSVTLADNRDRIEEALIQACQPALNEQLK